MSSKNEFIVFGAPDIQEIEIQEVVDTLRSGWIGTGPKVKKFERDFAAYKNIQPENALAVNSCTAALHLALVSSGIGPGDEVITTATTFCATINAVIHAGATPVLVDIDSSSLNIDVSLIEAAITKNTRAIIPVHMAGLPCDMDAIMDIANKHNLIVIEDCAHAIESEYNGKKIGTFGDFGCFSFYTTKNVVTAEGGMLIGKDGKKIELCRMLSLHGMNNDAWERFGKDGYKHYTVECAGYKYNMTDLSASLGIHQLARVDASWERRKDIYNYYLREMSEVAITLPPAITSLAKHAYHLFVIQIEQKFSKTDRDSFITEMKIKNIGTGVHYMSIVEHPFYSKTLMLNPESYPISVKYGRQTVSLPLSPFMDDEQVSRVVKAVKDVFVG